MKLSSLLQPKLIKCGLSAQNKQDALTELVRVLVGAHPGLGEQELLSALADREKLGPFSMGRGVAFPHARTEKVSDFTIVFGTSASGIDFRAPDGHKVKVAILFVIPKKHSNLYLQALAAFLNVLAVEANLARVVDAKTPGAVIATLDALAGKPKDATGPVESSGVASVALGTTLAKAMETLAAARADALPVVDAEGALVGELTAASILQLGVKEHMLALASPSLNGAMGLDAVLRQHADSPVETIPGLVTANGFKTVQEDEPPLDVAVRLVRGGSRGAYVLRGRKLVGVVTAGDLLRRLGR